MAKKTIEQLDRKICRELGKRYTACYDNPDSEEYEGTTYRIDVLEYDEEAARDIIKDAGYEVLDEFSFCGSDWDGYSFIIK